MYHSGFASELDRVSGQSSTPRRFDREEELQEADE